MHHHCPYYLDACTGVHSSCSVHMFPCMQDPLPGKVPYVIPARHKIASHDQPSHPHKMQPSTSPSSPPHSSDHKTAEQQFHRLKSMTPSSHSHKMQPSIPPSSQPSHRMKPSTPPSSQPSHRMKPSTPPSSPPSQPSTPPSSPSDRLINENRQYPHLYMRWPSTTPPSSPSHTNSQPLLLPLSFGLTIPALLHTSLLGNIPRPAAASLEPGLGQAIPSQLRLPLDLGPRPAPSFVIRPTIAVFPSPPLTPFPPYKHSGQ